MEVARRLGDSRSHARLLGCRRNRSQADRRYRARAHQQRLMHHGEQRDGTSAESFEFDPTTHSVVGDDGATKLLKRPYRKPYVHPADV